MAATAGRRPHPSSGQPKQPTTGDEFDVNRDHEIQTAHPNEKTFQPINSPPLSLVEGFAQLAVNNGAACYLWCGGGEPNAPAPSDGVFPLGPARTVHRSGVRGSLVTLPTPTPADWSTLGRSQLQKLVKKAIYLASPIARLLWDKQASLHQPPYSSQFSSFDLSFCAIRKPVDKVKYTWDSNRREEKKLRNR